MKLGRHGLPLRSAVIASRRRRLRILAAIAALLCSGFIAAVAHEAWPRRAEVMADLASVLQSSAPTGVTPVAAPVAVRPVYRHSIVPGGAYSRREVAEAMRTDAVVAAHYEHVDVDKVHLETITAARAVYVSYRVGNKVYWTKNRVRLAPGETVLTDGDTEIRARCGNLLSDNARQPVAADEPPLALLDEPETGSSTIAGARGPEGLTHVPFFDDSSESSSVAFEKNDPIPGAPGVDLPLGFGGAGGGVSPYLGSSTGTTGTSLVAPLGGSQRGGSSGGGGSNGSNGSNDHNGGGNGNNGSNGSNGSNDHNGDGNGNNGKNGDGGSNGGNGSNGGGSGGGGTDEKFVPPIVPELTTTGGTTTTTGNVVIDTTGGNDDDGEVPSVPEPSTLLLLGLGVCGAASRALRRRRD